MERQQSVDQIKLQNSYGCYKRKFNFKCFNSIAHLIKNEIKPMERLVELNKMSRNQLAIMIDNKTTKKLDVIIQPARLLGRGDPNEK